MTAGRQREDRQRMLAVENRLHDSRQGEAMQVDGEHRRGRPRFLQQRRRLFGIVRLADQQLDVAQGLLRLGQAGLHGFHLLGIRVPAAILRSGGTGEDHADPCFPRGFGGRFGRPSVRPSVRPSRAGQQQTARRDSASQELSSRAVLTHRNTLPFRLHQVRTDQKSLFERVVS
jgi:hypothetical protein